MIEAEPLTAPRLSVVVLAYNEAANLRAATDELVAELLSAGVAWELLLVDDGSTDGTGAIADAIAVATTGVRVIHHGTNLGLGAGYRSGFVHARGEYLTFFPADGQFPPGIITDFLPRVAEVDMVLGYLPERRSSPLAKGLSSAERLLYRVLFGPLPRFQGILMFRRRMLDEISLRSTGRGWVVLMELIIRASRGPYRIVSVATALRPRRSGRSKVNNLRTIVANLTQLFKLRATLGSA